MGNRGDGPQAEISQPSDNANDTTYFFEQLLKGTQASFLKQVSMDQLGRSGIESFVRNSKCRVRWTDSLVEVKCFHHAIKRKLPLDSAEQNAQVLVELLSLAQVSDLPADELAKTDGTISLPHLKTLSPATTTQLR